MTSPQVRIEEGTLVQIYPEATYLLGDEVSGAKKFYLRTSHMDKFFKILNWIPKFIALVLETDHVSPQTVDGLRSLASDFIFIRNGVGLWNGFQSIPKLLIVWFDFMVTCQGYELVHNKSTGVLEKRKVTMSATMRFLAIMSKGCKLLEWISFNICFIICAPAQWLDRWFQLGPHAKQVGSKFGLFFLIKDIFIVFALFFDLTQKKFEPRRLELLKKYTGLSDSELNEYVKLENDYRKAKFDAAIVSVKSIADIILGFSGVLHVKMNPWLQVCLGAISSVVGGYEIWRDTPPGALAKRDMMPDCLRVNAEVVRERVRQRQAASATASAA